MSHHTCCSGGYAAASLSSAWVSLVCLQKVKEVAQNLQQRASKGATQSEIRSGVSGTEQQLNALKAIVGLN